MIRLRANGYRVGVDLGGTKIEAAVISADGGIVARRRVATPRSYEATLEAIAALVAATEEEALARLPDTLRIPETEDGTTNEGEPLPVGVGIPGTLSPATGLVKNANSTWLIGHALDSDLAARLGQPVRLMNDANCFALSEARDGAGAGADSVFGVILGTGVGGGLVLHGEVISGHQGVAGEWGHNPIPWPTEEEIPGPECYCGRRGCIETFLSGPGMERDYFEHTGERRTTREIAGDLADNAHAEPARAAFARYVDRLARGLATVINIVDPEVIVLGGGMSNFPDLAPRAREALPRYVFTDEVRTRVVLNHHGDSSGVRGAAWLWPLPGK
ncbi:MAG: ROK family protein [Gemmatimonadota bacterium]